MSGSPYSDEFWQAFIAGFAIVYGLMLLIIVALWIVTAIAMMGFFRKVGVEPWKAWIPILNQWTFLEVGGHSGALALLSLVPFGSYVVLVFQAIGMHRTGIAFGKDVGFLVLGIFLPFVWMFLLARQQEVYDLNRLAWAGQPMPRAGYGAVPR
ncbi:DUF5684 domain-containing protein [Schumannella sp. 10F1B-5-1]|uniref:DUF5684 domain-containing protein n=1 Tax=Schumannella sp. 10F1B-5-1 TaxID=2590780 RepID=UPI0011318934|nr:DUF5684 domain-containing protein [Schumannella sp. 10F1B-5-1]TPW73761.1 hypothetical protein FJ658_03840 [Schumannella sp. 10F1B-5-1]